MWTFNLNTNSGAGSSKDSSRAKNNTHTSLPRNPNLCVTYAKFQSQSHTSSSTAPNTPQHAIYDRRSSQSKRKNADSEKRYTLTKRRKVSEGKTTKADGQSDKGCKSKCGRQHNTTGNGEKSRRTERLGGSATAKGLLTKAGRYSRLDAALLPRRVAAVGLSGAVTRHLRANDLVLSKSHPVIAA
ncbi:Hypothetical protein CINCED_3A024755 [Cinara cedri]|uniref:Uncharacterized protein n=1 Tax=Cinara cedri TaxID=506608 RepID=A0A5E4M121_9HEMI|nr:Hypothetical protein CINCED_3A024755 [Cinara cedri]